MLQYKVVKALQNPKAYDVKIRKIKLLQTHISYIFLTGKYAYKIKKPVNFGFLDFTTLENRKFYCEEELRLNRRLCGDMYVSVLPITLSGGVIKINGAGEVVEYVLKMKEIPQNAMMSQLLNANKVDKNDMDKIAETLFHFHNNAETSDEIDKFGSLETIKFNWDENFNQTREFIGRTVSVEDFAFINQKVNHFMDEKKILFEDRVNKGKIRDCHGDLHSANIFITDKPCLFDAIEFNKRFRYADVASDIAFLTMDLGFLGRKDLAEYFLFRYLNHNCDKELLNILPFYECYRAFVRGKVMSFKLNDSNITEVDKIDSEKSACKYFDLSVEYAKKLS